MWYTYILRSINFPDQEYTGATADLKQRVIDHNSGKSSHTAKYAPWELLWYGAFPDKYRALEFEAYLKSPFRQSVCEEKAQALKAGHMLIYKVCTTALWEETQCTGVFPGMPIDIEDGYIHFSTAEQQPETIRKYFAGQTGLMLLTVDATKLGEALQWESSSSGGRAGKFPHLHAPLKLSEILAADPLS